MSEHATIEQAREEIQKAERPESAWLWFGLLGAPAAWAVQLLVNYNMEESFLCAPGIGDADKGNLLGLSLTWWITAFNIVLFAVAVAGLVAAYLCRNRLMQSPGPKATGHRAQWMATAGLAVSVSFVLIIGIGFAPVFFLDTCQNPL